MPDIRHMIEIAAPPEDIYPLVATGKGLTRWWAEDVIMNDADSTADVGFFGRQTVYKLHGDRMKPAKRAEWLCTAGSEHWSGTRLIFEIVPTDLGCTLRFTHAHWNLENEQFIQANTRWGEVMFRLKAAAEGKEPGPLFTKDGMAEGRWARAIRRKSVEEPSEPV